MHKCCANCRWYSRKDKNNKYGDVEHFCIATGYFMLSSEIYKNIENVKMYAPGGRELVCKYEKIK